MAKIKNTKQNNKLQRWWNSFYNCHTWVRHQSVLCLCRSKSVLISQDLHSNMTWQEIKLISVVFSKWKPLPFTPTKRRTQRGRSDAEKNHDTTEADLTLFPPVSLTGSPCWSPPRLPHSTPGQTNPRIRGCGGEVGVCLRECQVRCFCSAPTTSSS